MTTVLDRCKLVAQCEYLEAIKHQRDMAQRLWRDKPCPYGMPIPGEVTQYYCEKRNIVCTLHEIGRHCDIYTKEVSDNIS